ncbi:unnamed protein product [Pieris macdunnoughi]|uniref:Uncharacterized protein n=1 Tax=Pieris macdunnoughi TaxID=345717 RepID=A0A821QZA5_9NEOP|nr:unnamed protein product [Pieris macdunnoughi]
MVPKFHWSIFICLAGVLHLPTISAAITKEKVPCLRSDGSMGQMDVCKDEWGRRVDCPVENDDDGDDVDELTKYTFQSCSGNDLLNTASFNQ